MSMNNLLCDACPSDSLGSGNDSRGNGRMGLVIFAIINFVLSGIEALFLLVAIISSAEVRTAVNVSISIISVLERIIAIGLPLISGIGFLKLRYGMGYVCGITMCVLMLYHNIGLISINPLQGVSEILISLFYFAYPAFLLFILMFKYRRLFRRSTNGA